MENQEVNVGYVIEDGEIKIILEIITEEKEVRYRIAANVAEKVAQGLYVELARSGYFDPKE